MTSLWPHFQLRHSPTLLAGFCTVLAKAQHHEQLSPCLWTLESVMPVLGAMSWEVSEFACITQFHFTFPNYRGSVLVLEPGIGPSSLGIIR